MSPFDEGLLAASNGMDELDNPYMEGTDAHTEWAQGFDDGSRIPAGPEADGE